MTVKVYTPGRHRSFHHYGQTWYFEASNIDPRCVDAVNIVLGSADGEGCDYEFKIEWRDIGCDAPAPLVLVFDESWMAFAECADVFAWMARQTETPTPVQVCEALMAMGFVDRTERVQS